MRLIDADALGANLDGMMAVNPTGYIHGDTVADMIGDAPTIEPERKMGKWLKPKGHDDARCCSECKYICHKDYAQFYIYCPNCGAQMERDE